MTAEDRVRTVREAYQATIAANQQGGAWINPWAAVVAALDAHDEPHTKALAEVATKLGVAIGRKAAGDEIAVAIAEHRRDFKTGGAIDPELFVAQEIALLVASPAQEAPSEPLTPSTSHSDLPEGDEGL